MNSVEGKSSISFQDSIIVLKQLIIYRDPFLSLYPLLQFG